MPTKDEFAEMSKSTLKHYLTRYTVNAEEYQIIISEIDKREKIEEANTNAQLSRNLFWSKIAGIGAIVGIVLMIAQILLSIYQDKSSKGYDAPQVQRQVQDSQRPTRNQVSPKSSSNISSSITPSKKMIPTSRSTASR